jgi:flavorubredoxin
MMTTHELFGDSQRRWVYFGRDPDRMHTIIDTNQYLILHNEAGALLDPGGIEIFPPYVAALSREVDLEKVEHIVSSHQDPDVISSLGLWLDVCPQVQVHVPFPWMLFIPHMSGGTPVREIPDEGMTLPLGGSNDLELIPAHYLHSSGNFSLYDPRAKILFTGDIGAALLPPEHDGIFVEDFDAHIQYMEAFHKRWMPSEEAKSFWLERVRGLAVDILAPQHGALFRGADVARFLDWFDQLPVASAWAGARKAGGGPA